MKTDYFFLLRAFALYSMVDGSRQQFFCFVGGKKIKIKTSLPNSVGAKKLFRCNMSEEKKKETKIQSNKWSLYLGL